MEELVSTIELNLGEEKTVRLPGLGSVGYEWDYRIDGGSTVVEVSVSTTSPPTAFTPDAPPPSNYSIDTILKIRGISKGLATIVCIQKRRQTDQTKTRHVMNIEVRGPLGLR